MDVQPPGGPRPSQPIEKKDQIAPAKAFTDQVESTMGKAHRTGIRKLALKFVVAASTLFRPDKLHKKEVRAANAVLRQMRKNNPNLKGLKYRGIQDLPKILTALKNAEHPYAASKGLKIKFHNVEYHSIVKRWINALRDKAGDTPLESDQQGIPPLKTAGDGSCVFDSENKSPRLFIGGRTVSLEKGEFPSLLKKEGELGECSVFKIPFKGHTLDAGRFPRKEGTTDRGVLIWNNMNAASWRNPKQLKQIFELQKAGYEVIAYDYSGVGLSGGEISHPYECAQNCKAVADWYTGLMVDVFGEPVEKLTLAGQSLGGFSAPAAALLLDEASQGNGPKLEVMTVNTFRSLSAAAETTTADMLRGKRSQGQNRRNLIGMLAGLIIRKLGLNVKTHKIAWQLHNTPNHRVKLTMTQHEADAQIYGRAQLVEAWESEYGAEAAKDFEHAEQLVLRLQGGEHAARVPDTMIERMAQGVKERAEAAEQQRLLDAGGSIRGGADAFGQ